MAHMAQTEKCCTSVDGGRLHGCFQKPGEVLTVNCGWGGGDTWRGMVGCWYGGWHVEGVHRLEMRTLFACVWVGVVFVVRRRGEKGKNTVCDVTLKYR